VTSVAVDSVSEGKRLVPYCKTTFSPEWVGELHVPDAAYTKYVLFNKNYPYTITFNFCLTGQFLHSHYMLAGAAERF